MNSIDAVKKLWKAAAVIDPNLKPLESSLNESYNREKQRTIVDNQI